MSSAITTPTRCGLLSAPAAPSKIHVRTAECQRVAFTVSNSFQKLDFKTFNGNLLSARNYSCQRLRFLVKADSGGIPLEPGCESSSLSPKSIFESVKHEADVFYRFLKPYVILGKLIEVLSMSLLAMDKLSDFSTLYVKGVLKTMAAATFMVVYICGLNQLTDLEIDKVNKPNRPLASGEYSFKTGSIIVAISIILCLSIAWSERSWPLLGLHIGQLVVGTLYSITIDLPLLKWKRSAFFPVVWTVIFYGLIQPVSYCMHFQTKLLQKPFTFSKSLMCTGAFMSIFSIILAIFKDIPDLEGDKKYGVDSFATRFGQKRVFWFCVIVLEMVYGAAICIGAMSSNPWSKLVMILGHSVLAIRLWNGAKQADIKKQESTEAFYMFLWKLLNAEYLLIPFVRF